VGGGKFCYVFHCGRNIHRVLIGNTEEKRLLGKHLQRGNKNRVQAVVMKCLTCGGKKQRARHRNGIL
jgi:hypothetical protein